MLSGKKYNEEKTSEATQNTATRRQSEAIAKVSIENPTYENHPKTKTLWSSIARRLVWPVSTLVCILHHDTFHLFWQDTRQKYSLTTVSLCTENRN